MCSNRGVLGMRCPQKVAIEEGGAARLWRVEGGVLTEGGLLGKGVLRKSRSPRGGVLRDNGDRAIARPASPLSESFILHGRIKSALTRPHQPA